MSTSSSFPPAEASSSETHSVRERNPGADTSIHVCVRAPVSVNFPASSVSPACVGEITVARAIGFCVSRSMTRPWIFTEGVRVSCTSSIRPAGATCRGPTTSDAASAVDAARYTCPEGTSSKRKRPSSRVRVTSGTAALSETRARETGRPSISTKPETRAPVSFATGGGGSRSSPVSPEEAWEGADGSESEGQKAHARARTRTIPAAMSSLRCTAGI